MRSIQLTSIDIGRHPYTEPAAGYLRAAAGHRFTFVRMDSCELRARTEELRLVDHDVVHIDGGHDPDVFTNDLTTVLACCSAGTIVIVDDAYVAGIQSLTAQFQADGSLRPHGDLQTKESAVYVIAAPPRRRLR